MIKINFGDFTRTIERIENTSSQNEIVAILSGLFKDIELEEIDKACYMVLGQIAPQYESIVRGLSEKTVQSTISLAGGIPKDEVEEKTRDLGDIGEVAVKMVKNTENPFKDYFDYL